MSDLEHHDRHLPRRLRRTGCDPPRRARHPGWAVNGQLVDPPLDGAGRTAISRIADAVQQPLPRSPLPPVRPASTPTTTFARYGWELVAADGTVAVTGVDVAELTDHGQLVRVVGFFGELPPKE